MSKISTQSTCIVNTTNLSYNKRLTINKIDALANKLLCILRVANASVIDRRDQISERINTRGGHPAIKPAVVIDIAHTRHETLQAVQFRIG